MQCRGMLRMITNTQMQKWYSRVRHAAQCNSDQIRRPIAIQKYSEAPVSDRSTLGRKSGSGSAACARAHQRRRCQCVHRKLSRGCGAASKSSSEHGHSDTSSRTQVSASPRIARLTPPSVSPVPALPLLPPAAAAAISYCAAACHGLLCVAVSAHFVHAILGVRFCSVAGRCLAFAVRCVLGFKLSHM